MDTIIRMTDFLEQQARDSAQAVVTQAGQSAQRIRKEGLMQAQRLRNEILEAHKRDAQVIAEQAQAEARREGDRRTLAARQELIDAVLREVRTRYDARSEAEEMALLRLVFTRSVESAAGVCPVVLVPPHQIAAARAVLPPNTQVAAGTMEKGFVLSFEKYNVNYENETIFRFRRDRLETLAAAELFGGHSDEENRA